MTGSEILAKLEEHSGAKVEDRRLRFQITATLDRLIAENEATVRRIRAVLAGAETFDPRYQKAINQPARKR